MSIESTSDDTIGSSILLDDKPPQGTSGIPCTCNGYADAVDTTKDEDIKYGCGRRSCCAGAFKCRLCGNRLIARFESPEME